MLSKPETIRSKPGFGLLWRSEGAPKHLEQVSFATPHQGVLFENVWTAELIWRFRAFTT